MPRQIPALFTFNRGLISSIALARSDNKRVAMGAETMVNFIPRVLGPMSLRPGLKYVGTISGSPGPSRRTIPFVFSTTDTALIDVSSTAIKFWVNDAIVNTNAAVSTVTNQYFDCLYGTVTMTNATPIVVSYSGTDGYANNDEVQFGTTGALVSPLLPNVSYYVVNLNLGAKTFQVAATVGGAAIAGTGAGSGVHTCYSLFITSGWTKNDESGASSHGFRFNGVGVNNWLALIGTGTTYAKRDQLVTLNASDINKQITLFISVYRGPVVLRVGTSPTDDSYIGETSLLTGEHALSFTPTGNFNIQFKNANKRVAVVSSCSLIASSAPLFLDNPWNGYSTAGAWGSTTDINSILRYDQSGDIIFIATGGNQQYMIQRRGTRSWSVVLYQPNDGPFDIINTGAISLTPSALSGNVVLTASAELFNANHVGELYKLVSIGQTVQVSASAQDTWTSSIRVTGVGTQRTFTVNLTGTWVGRVRVQYSLDSATGPWIDHATLTWTANTTTTYADGFDNQIVYYRIGVKTAEYTSGTAVCKLSISTGSIAGVCRITDYLTPTTAKAEVITEFGGTAATYNWYEGEWSIDRGFPSSVRFHEGRLWWAGSNGIWGSVSDQFLSYPNDAVGDSGTINRTIGSGPVDKINWLLSLQRLIIGAQGTEFTARSSSLDEPLSPTNFNVKPASTQGSAAVDPARIDQRGIFVQRGGIKVYDVGFDMQSYDYNSKDLTAIVPELGLPGIVRVAVQRQPDTRIHCLRSDGTVMMAVYDAVEEVLAWCNVTTNGTIKDIVVLPGQPGSTEDQVYYVVDRGNGCFLEKWSKETEARGGTYHYQADAWIQVTNGTPQSIITGLGHLEGYQVCVWADGVDVGTNNDYTYLFTVFGGQIILPYPAFNVIIGIPYQGQWKSAKLSIQPSMASTMLNQNKRISHLGMVLANVHAHGIRFGPDFSHLDEMPRIEGGTSIGDTAVRSSYDEQEFEFPTTWVTDMRLCLQAQSPRPVTVMGITVDLEVHD